MSELTIVPLRWRNQNLKREYAGLPGTDTGYFQALHKAVKACLSTGEFYYNSELQAEVLVLLNGDLAITETEPLLLDTSAMDYREALRTENEFQCDIKAMPRGTWGIITSWFHNGGIYRQAIMSNGSKGGSLGNSDTYFDKAGERPSFAASLARLFEGDIGRMRSIVEYEMALEKNLQAQGTTTLCVGMVVKDVDFYGDKFSTLTITEIKDGVVHYQTTRKGFKMRWEGRKDIANLHDLLSAQGKLPESFNPFVSAVSDAGQGNLFYLF